MRDKLRSQGDLFQERPTATDLLPEVRAKLDSLLKTLLAEAADIGLDETKACDPRQGGSDDQDHA